MTSSLKSVGNLLGRSCYPTPDKWLTGVLTIYHLPGGPGCQVLPESLSPHMLRYMVGMYHPLPSTSPAQGLGCPSSGHLSYIMPSLFWSPGLLVYPLPSRSPGLLTLPFPLPFSLQGPAQSGHVPSGLSCTTPRSRHVLIL